MTKETFTKALNDKNIWWNNIVKLTVHNPKYKWWYFGICEFINIEGALNYCDGDNIVELCSGKFDKRLCYVELWDAAFYSFNFSEIVDIEKIRS